MFNWVSTYYQPGSLLKPFHNLGWKYLKDMETMFAGGSGATGSRAFHASDTTGTLSVSGGTIQDLSTSGSPTPTNHPSVLIADSTSSSSGFAGVLQAPPSARDISTVPQVASSSGAPPITTYTTSGSGKHPFSMVSVDPNPSFFFPITIITLFTLSSFSEH